MDSDLLVTSVCRTQQQCAHVPMVQQPQEMIAPQLVQCSVQHAMMGTISTLAPMHVRRSSAHAAMEMVRLVPTVRHMVRSSASAVQDRDVCLLAVSSTSSAPVNSHGVTGGVYKARERIHRGVLIRDY